MLRLLQRPLGPLLLLAAALAAAGAVRPAAAARGLAQAAESAAAAAPQPPPAAEAPAQQPPESMYGSAEVDACIRVTNSAGQACTVESDTRERLIAGAAGRSTGQREAAGGAAAAAAAAWLQWETGGHRARRARRPRRAQPACRSDCGASSHNPPSRAPCISPPCQQRCRLAALPTPPLPQCPWSSRAAPRSCPPPSRWAPRQPVEHASGANNPPVSPRPTLTFCVHSLHIRNGTRDTRPLSFRTFFPRCKPPSTT